MSDATVTAIALAAIFGVLFAAAVLRARAEERKNDRWLEAMREMSRECPACKPWGGWYLGRMREDGSYETHTCEVCGGTGKLPDGAREQAGTKQMSHSAAANHNDGGIETA